MQMEEGIVIYATEAARKKWEGKEFPKKCGKSGCPSCETGAMKKEHRENSREE
jgi:hypothetical protein